MLLAVKAKRSTFTSKRIGRQRSRHRECAVSISLACLQIIARDDEVGRCSWSKVPAVFRAAIFCFHSMTVLQQQHCLKRRSLSPLRDHAFALLHRAVIAPPQMRRRAAQRTPRFGERRHLLRRRARLQAEADLDALPARRGRRPARHRHGRGRTADRRRRSTARCRAARSACDARHRHLLREHVEVQPLGGEFAREMLQGLDLGGRQAEPAEPVGAGAAHAPRGRTDRRRRTAGPRSPRRSRSTAAGRRRLRRARQSPARAAAAPACPRSRAPA